MEENMKGKFLLGLILFSILIVSAKPKPANVFDDTVPLEKSAVLLFDAMWTVKSYNDITVKLKKAFVGTEFYIPAGKAAFTLDLDSGRSFPNLRYTGSNINLTYNFEEGKEYLIRFWFSDDKGEVPKVAIAGKGTPSIVIHPGKDMKTVLAVFKLDLNK
jgi:hypothetical protein